MRRWEWGVLLALAAAQAGCATIFSGSSTKVRITSDPPGANVVVLGGGAGSVVLKAQKVAALADRLLGQVAPHLSEESMKELKGQSFENIIGIIAVSVAAPFRMQFLSEKTRQELARIPQPVRDLVMKILGVEATGKTPMSVELSKRGGYAVVVSLENRAPRVVGLDTSINWIILLNILNGFLGLPIDLLTGAAFNLEPESVHVRFGN